MGFTLKRPVWWRYPMTSLVFLLLLTRLAPASLNSRKHVHPTHQRYLQGVSGPLDRTPAVLKAVRKTTQNGSIRTPLNAFDITESALSLEFLDKPVQCPAGDGFAKARHEFLVVMQVVPRKQHGGDDLACPKHMMQVRPAVSPATGTLTPLVQRPRIICMPRVLDVHRTPAGKGLPSTA